MKPENITGVKKDKGEVLFADIKRDMKKYYLVTGKGLEKTLNEGILNVISLKEADPGKYENFSELAENFPGIWRKYEMKELEKVTNKKFTENIDRLIIINQLIELDKFNLAPELWKSIEKHTGEGKLPLMGAIDCILNNTTKEDYPIIERGLKIYSWDDIAYMMEHKKNMRYEMIADDKKFAQVEETIRKVEKEYGRKLKFEDTKKNLLLLSYPEYAEKILSLKGQINELEEFYKIDRIEHIDEFENIDDIKETGELGDILSDGFKTKIEKIKKFYYLDKFGSVKHLQSWLNLAQEKFETIVSDDFSKKVGNLGEQIGRSKAEVIYFFAGENFKNIEHPIVEALLEGKVIFSDDVREAKPDIFEILGNFPRAYTQEPSLWGRIRQSGVRNVVDMATLGRPDRG